MSPHIDGPMMTALLDGQLSASDNARCNGHLASCSACRHELDSLRHLKLVVSTAPRKTMPADLALTLERRFVFAPSWKRTVPRLWVPLGATAAALSIGLWMQGLRASEEIPLEPLLTAHARYSAEGLIPQENLVASTYSDQLASMDAESSDVELQ